MTRVRVKICGLTRLADAALAVEGGADAVGFIFVPSSARCLTRDQAGEITRALPPLVTRVGVFVDMPVADVERIADAAHLDVLQLHGDEDPAMYAALGRRVIKAVALGSVAALETASALDPAVVPLVDAAPADGARGGTGRTADWDLASRLAARRPVVLAGGLTPANVGDAIRRVRPWAVDVSSGVESAPGIKSPEKLRLFLARVREIQQEDA
jgi:phosphoribosylanthranilate isomerase